MLHACDFSVLLNLSWLTLKIFVYPDEEKRRPDIFHALKMGKRFRKSFWRFMNIGTHSPNLVFVVLFEATQSV